MHDSGHPSLDNMSASICALGKEKRELTRVRAKKRWFNEEILLKKAGGDNLLNITGARNRNVNKIKSIHDVWLKYIKMKVMNILYKHRR